MNLNDIPVGTYVTIRPDSEYYGRDANMNPADELGIVTEVGGYGGLDHEVMWLHSGEVNSYGRHDLKYWRGAVPAHGFIEEVADIRGKVVRRKKPKPAPQPIPKHDLDEGGINKAVVEAIEKCKRENQSVTARYAFVYKNGRTNVSGNTACHHSVLSLDHGSKKKLATIVTLISGNVQQEKHLSKEANITFYDWLLNRSPWCSAFVTKDAEGTYNGSRYVRMNLDVPANLLQGALIATRQTWEHHHVVDTFATLVEAGIPENEAFLLGCMFRKSGSSKLVRMFQGGGHFPLEINDMRTGCAKNFCMNKPSKPTENYSEGGDAWGVHDLFYTKKAGGERLGDYAKALVNKVGLQGITFNTNPFSAAKKVETETMKIESLVSYIKENGVFV